MPEQFQQAENSVLTEDTPENSIAGELPSRIETNLDLPETVTQTEMTYVAGQVNKALRGTKIQIFRDIKVGGSELTYLSSNRVTQVGPYVFAIAGQPEDFIGNIGFLQRRLKGLQRQIGIYLDSYPNNVFAVPASHTVEVGLRKQYPLSPHTALMVAQLACLRTCIPGLKIADLACGDGILSQVLMAEKAASVFLVDYEDSLLDMAKMLLQTKAAQLQESNDESTSVEMRPENLWQLEKLPAGKTVELVILHLGPFYDSEGPLHACMTERLSNWPDTRIILSGGYHTVEPGHQEALSNDIKTLSEAGYHTETVKYRTLALMAAIRAGKLRTT